MPQPNDEKLARRAEEFRNNPTRQEERLWRNLLDGLRPPFRRQQVIEDMYIVDFYCPEAKLVVEVEGRRRSGEKAKLHDRQRARLLDALGLRVLRFSDWEIDEHFFEVCERITAALAAAGFPRR